MTKRRSLIVPAVLAGVLLLALAVLYIVEPASSLPVTSAPGGREDVAAPVTGPSRSG